MFIKEKNQCCHKFIIAAKFCTRTSELEIDISLPLITLTSKYANVSKNQSSDSHPIEKMFLSTSSHFFQTLASDNDNTTSPPKVAAMSHFGNIADAIRSR